MAKDYAKSFYKSSKWRKCRASFIADRVMIDGGTCQHCRDALGYIIDHIKEITPENINDPEITLNHENLQYLCLVCHNRKTFKKLEVIERGLVFDELGQLQQVERLD